MVLVQRCFAKKTVKTSKPSLFVVSFSWLFDYQMLVDPVSAASQFRNPVFLFLNHGILLMDTITNMRKATINVTTKTTLHLVGTRLSRFLSYLYSLSNNLSRTIHVSNLVLFRRKTKQLVSSLQEKAKIVGQKKERQTDAPFCWIRVVLIWTCQR